MLLALRRRDVLRGLDDHGDPPGLVSDRRIFGAKEEGLPRSAPALEDAGLGLSGGQGLPERRVIGTGPIDGIAQCSMVCADEVAAIIANDREEKVVDVDDRSIGLERNHAEGAVDGLPELIELVGGQG
jgi:hypothetical protein